MFQDILEPKVKKHKLKFRKNCLNNMASESYKNGSNMASEDHQKIYF